MDEPIDYHAQLSSDDAPRCLPRRPRARHGRSCEENLLHRLNVHSARIQKIEVARSEPLSDPRYVPAVLKFARVAVRAYAKYGGK
jgi:hypothetical protein